MAPTRHRRLTSRPDHAHRQHDDQQPVRTRGNLRSVGFVADVRSWRAATAGLHLPPVGVVARFGSPEQAEFPHGQRRSADSLVATLATRAGLLVMPEQERRATLGRIRAFLASRPETSSDDFALPMLTGVLRVRQL